MNSPRLLSEIIVILAFCELCSYDLRWWLHDPVLPGWNFNPSSRDRFHPAITWGNHFSSRQGGTGFHLVFVYKNPYISIDLKMFTKWWNSIKTFVYFFLRDWHHMRRKNTIEITTIYWNVLMKFFRVICQLTFSTHLGRLKRLHGKISSRQSGILAVQKRDPPLPRWNILRVIARYKFMKNL